MKRYELGFYYEGREFTECENPGFEVPEGYVAGTLGTFRMGEPVLLVQRQWLTEVPPPIPAEPEPGAYLIGDRLCVRSGNRLRAESWIIVSDDGHDYTDWVGVWEWAGGPDVSIVPLVPKVDWPTALLPWVDGPFAVRVREDGTNCSVQLDHTFRNAVMVMTPRRARAMAAALLTAAGHKAIEEQP